MIIAEQLPLFEGELRRDAGITAVIDNNKDWMDVAISRLRYLDFDEATGEDFRMLLELPEPKHSNAWGAFVRTAIARGLIVPTGNWVKMRDPRSHARMTPLYRKQR
jgi:hypothetical protein